MNGCKDTAQQEEALAAFGLAPEAPLQEPATELWPEHAAAVRLFNLAGTQWVVGPASVVGLRYESLPMLRDALGIPQEDWPAVLADLQVLERESLRLWREKRR